jgi:excisionase family DNA binding protein
MGAWLCSWFHRVIVMRATAVRSVEVTPPDGLDQLASSDRLMTAKEVARLLAISEKTIYGYVSKGLIPYYKIQSSVRFRARDVNAWLSRQMYPIR